MNSMGIKIDHVKLYHIYVDSQSYISYMTHLRIFEAINILKGCNSYMQQFPYREESCKNVKLLKIQIPSH